jgi:hypothetical protein
LPDTAGLDAVVTHQSLNGFGEGTSIHALDQAEGVNALFAETCLTGAEQPILLPVMPQRWVAVPVSMVFGKGTPGHALSEVKTVEIPRDDRHIRNPAF